MDAKGELLSILKGEGRGLLEKGTLKHRVSGDSVSILIHEICLMCRLVHQCENPSGRPAHSKSYEIREA